MAQNGTVLAVYGYTRKVAYMLVGTGQGIEQGCLPAVLVAYERKAQHCAFRQRIAGAFRVELSPFAESRMQTLLRSGYGFLLRFLFFRRHDHDLPGIIQTQRQTVAVQPQFHRIIHRCIAHQCDFRPGNQTHIQEMLAESSLSSDFRYNCTLSGFQITHFHIITIAFQQK